MTKHPKAMSVSSSNNEIKSKNIRGKKNGDSLREIRTLGNGFEKMIFMILKYRPDCVLKLYICTYCSMGRKNH